MRLTERLRPRRTRVAGTPPAAATGSVAPPAPHPPPAAGAPRGLATASYIAAAVAAAATVAQAAFAYVQWQFSEQSFKAQQELAASAAADADKQAARLIAAAERLSLTSEQSTADAALAVRESLKQGREALALSSAVNARTSRLIEEAQQVFAAQALPAIKVTDYRLIVRDKETVSCEHPALGVTIYYANKGSVPVTQRSTSLRLSQAGQELVAPRADEPSKKIIMANEEQYAGAGGPAFARAFARRRHHDQLPFMANITVVYQALVTQRCYKYEATVRLDMICPLADQFRFNIDRDTIEPVACPGGSGVATD